MREGRKTYCIKIRRIKNERLTHARERLHEGVSVCVCLCVKRGVRESE